MILRKYLIITHFSLHFFVTIKFDSSLDPQFLFLSIVVKYLMETRLTLNLL